MKTKQKKCYECDRLRDLVRSLEVIAEMEHEQSKSEINKLKANNQIEINRAVRAAIDGTIAAMEGKKAKGEVIVKWLRMPDGLEPI